MPLKKLVTLFHFKKKRESIVVTLIINTYNLLKYSCTQASNVRDFKRVELPLNLKTRKDVVLTLLFVELSDILKTVMVIWKKNKLNFTLVYR